MKKNKKKRVERVGGGGKGEKKHKIESGNVEMMEEQ